ncbi:hypothetical protein AGOR_G00099920 [Albula goreensis]|uniref:Uncharacterized protein n=1 Tax=Albula goreensis TaxID=1534307 RepID=A0A8T3DNK0_9TELE|nr:hypothetical protein AGOR_G00099920 [Albula goreensis]
MWEDSGFVIRRLARNYDTQGFRLSTLQKDSFPISSYLTDLIAWWYHCLYSPTCTSATPTISSTTDPDLNIKENHQKGLGKSWKKHSTGTMGDSRTSSFLPVCLWLSIVLAVSFLKIEQASAESPEQSLTVDAEQSPPRKNKSCTGSYDCKEGVILPIWKPQNPSIGDKVARATVYFVALFYMFLGVSIIADRFMASIEVITSQEKEITIKKPNGETTTTTVRIWNETVSNLTLMALGSSAPEILLSVIEVCGHNFDAGALARTPLWAARPSTWVVQVWEGLLTLFFFPICVVFAWIADRRLLFYKYVYKRYRAGKQRGMIIETEATARSP